MKSTVRNTLKGIVLGSTLLFGCVSNSPPQRMPRPKMDAPRSEWQKYYDSIDLKDLIIYEQSYIQDFRKELARDFNAVSEGFGEFPKMFPRQTSFKNWDYTSNKDVVFMYTVFDQAKKEHKEPLIWGK